MKEGWEEKKMSSLYDVRDGTHDSPKYQDKGYPLVTSKNLKGGILDMSNVNFISESDYKAINSRSKVDIGDVLFAMIGTIGNPVYVEEEPNYAIKNMALFKVPREQSGEFLRYYLLNNIILSKMQSEAKGTTQKFVSLGYLRNFLISIPPLSEQQRIVDYLDAAFAKIDAMKANAEKSLGEAKALFQASLKEMLEPKEGWEEVELMNLCKKTYNIRWDNVTDDKSYMYIDLTSVNRESLKITDPQRIVKSNAPSRAKQIVLTGDVIFATTRPTLRRLCEIVEQYNEQLCSTGYCVLRPKENVISRWIFYCLQSDDFYSYIEPLQTGANYPAVTDGIVKEYKIPVPPLSEQQRIVATLDALKSKVDRLQANFEKISQECDALKQALLREVFEG